MESIYEYGARAGFWRLHRPLHLPRRPGHRLRRRHRARPLARPGRRHAGGRLGDRQPRPEVDRLPRPHAARPRPPTSPRRSASTPRSPASAPRGWYTGRCSVNTVDLVTEEGGFDWVSDTYDDDLPYWREHAGRQQLIIPYTLDANDMRFATPAGLQLRRPVLRLPQGQLRHPLRRGRGRHARR